MENSDKVLELKKLRESKPYQKLLKEYKNRAEVLESEVLLDYETNTIEKEMVYSKKDRLWEASKIILEIADDMPDSKGGDIYAEYLYSRVDQIRKVISRNLVDEIGVPYSSLLFTENDMLIIKMSEMLHNIEDALNQLIDSLEKPEEPKDDTVYE
jgi:hypothetical protein